MDYSDSDFHCVGNMDFVTYDEFEKAVAKLKARENTTILTPEQVKQLQEGTAEIGRAFLEGRVKLAENIDCNSVRGHGAY